MDSHSGNTQYALRCAVLVVCCCQKEGRSARVYRACHRVIVSDRILGVVWSEFAWCQYFVRGGSKMWTMTVLAGCKMIFQTIFQQYQDGCRWPSCPRRSGQLSPRDAQLGLRCLNLHEPPWQTQCECDVTMLNSPVEEANMSISGTTMPMTTIWSHPRTPRNEWPVA